MHIIFDCIYYEIDLKDSIILCRFLSLKELFHQLRVSCYAQQIKGAVIKGD
jgi:hypothetical protein